MPPLPAALSPPQPVMVLLYCPMAVLGPTLVVQPLRLPETPVTPSGKVPGGVYVNTGWPPIGCDTVTDTANGARVTEKPTS